MSVHRGAPHDDVPAALRRVLGLLAVAVLTGMLIGAFGGILLFIAGLTALAAYAASHPRRA